MTITEIVEAIRPLKSLTREGLYPHLHALKIKPLGARQRPQRYPDDTAERVLIRLGFTKTPAFPPASRRNGQPKRRTRAVA